jgi:dTDP-4-dehydrorhamnose 3,5-epimerase-like enzyme
LLEKIDIRAIKVPGEYDGVISVLESSRDSLFDIKRVYYTYGARRGEVRGHHAHKTLSQLLICVYGSIIIRLDDGTQKNETLLCNPSEGLFVKPGVWHTMEWKEADSILLVLASADYDSNDYIRSYDAFIEWVERG